MKDPELDDGVITFSFKVGGVPVSCGLEATPEGGYSGPCEEEAGGGSITMEPPE